MNTTLDIRRAGLVAALLAVGSCSGGEAAPAQAAAAASGTGGSGMSHAAAAEGVVEPAGPRSGAGPWSATSASGVRVTVAFPRAPILPGPVRVAVAVDDPAGSATARSLDLVSPTMPAHGVLRYPVVDGGAGIEIPMEGSWAIYVNLDEDGVDTAEFLFDVAAGPGGGHQHGGMDMAVPPADTGARPPAEAGSDPHVH